MFIRKRNPFDSVGGTETSEKVFFDRRKILQLAGCGAGTSLLAATGYFGWRRWQGTDQAVIGNTPQGSELEREFVKHFPAPSDPRFHYDRPETDRAEAARYTNFYEFSSFKWVWRYVDQFQPYPWRITVGGLCRNPLMLDLNQLVQQFGQALAERQYRHRCVERWAMAIPWTGIPLSKILLAADPLPTATHVVFVSFNRPEEAPRQASAEYPWPYTEGLTLAEAMNDLTFLATGMYGQPLLKQHGAPIRLVVPWKYGFKSIKSIERIEFVDSEPPTFWSTLNPAAYPFESNVDPQVPRPWPQHQERMLGTNNVLPTQRFNGYENYVAHLYRS